MKLTKTQKLLMYGLKQLNTSEEDMVIIMVSLQEEEEQLEMIQYLASHLDATDQDILKKLCDIVTKRKKFTIELPD